MNRICLIIVLGATVMFASAHAASNELLPVGPCPTKNQWEWQKREMITMVHFGPNTLKNIERVKELPTPDQFNPPQVDCRQWCRAFKAGGSRAVVLVAKHIDGFCLWPTKTTSLSVKNSPWQQGKGDLVSMLASACREAGLDMGIYVSAYDLSSPLYGTGEKYDQYLKSQLTEVLVGYGDMCEVWFDGVGFLAPSHPQRCNWPDIFSFVHELAPKACIFSDIGPDIRWCGSEKGAVGYPNWNMIDPAVLRLGKNYRDQMIHGDVRGSKWIPAECDVSIHRGWFYREGVVDSLKSLNELMEIYFNTVGRGAVLNLNVPPDKRGLIAEDDVARLKEFGAEIDAYFKSNLSKSAQIAWASADGRPDLVKEAAHLSDNDLETYVPAPTDGKGVASLVMTCPTPVRVSCLQLGEYLPLGQRIRSFVLEAGDGATWQRVADGSSVGTRMLLRFAPVTASSFRVTFSGGEAAPVLTEAGLFAGRQQSR